MKIRSDFSKREVVKPGDIDWVPSPLPGVDRLMYDRIGEEVARATSLVRYAPNSRFSSHTHDGGEEFFVLDGTFSDAGGDYRAGTYVRNPIGTSHAPWSDEGCTIFVKLWQFHKEDQIQRVINSNDADWLAGDIDSGVDYLPLHEFGTEKVVLQRFQSGARFPAHNVKGGEEIFVLEGSLEEDREKFMKGSWLRIPDGAEVGERYSTEGCKLFVKTGHLSG